MNVTFIVAGSLRETVGTKSEIAGPLSVVLKPAGTEHADEFGPAGAVALSVRLDQSFIKALQDWERDLVQWRWQHSGGATKWFLLLLKSLQRTNDESRTATENAIYEMLAALCHVSAAAPCHAPQWLQRVKLEIDDDVENCGRVRDLAERAGVHPVYLARQFRSYLGVSVSEYVRQRRVAATAQLLLRDHESLASIACEAGFSDQSHMGRIFKHKTGLTPHAYRRIVSNVL